MSFSFEAKNELCRLPVQKLCCARAEAYGILLYCNTFSASEVRICLLYTSPSPRD